MEKAAKETRNMEQELFSGRHVRHDLLGLWNVWMVAGARERGLLVIV